MFEALMCYKDWQDVDYRIQDEIINVIAKYVYQL